MPVDPVWKAELEEELANLAKRPVAFDRHFKLPIFHEQLPKGIRGQFSTYNKSYPNHPTYNALKEQLRLIGEKRGSPKVIKISKNIPQSYYGDDEYKNNSWNKVMKHELAHALQSELHPEGQMYGQNIAPPPSYALRFMEKLLGDPVQDYRRSLRKNEGLPFHEVDAYTLSDTLGASGFPENRAMIDEAKRRQLAHLRSMGLGKYTKIWEGR